MAADLKVFDFDPSGAAKLGPSFARFCVRLVAGSSSAEFFFLLLFWLLVSSSFLLFFFASAGHGSDRRSYGAALVTGLAGAEGP